MPHPRSRIPPLTLQSPPGLKPRWGITRKLGLSFLLLFAILGAAAYYAMSGLFELHVALHAVERDAKRQGTVLRLASAVRDQYAHMAHTLILGNDSHATYHADAHTTVRKMADRAERRARTGAERDLVREIRDASVRLHGLFEGSLLPAVRRGDSKTAAALHDSILTIVSGAQQKAEELSDASERSIASFGAHAEIVEHVAIRLSSIFLVSAMLFAVGMAIFLHRSVTVPVRRLAAGTAQIATGDLDTKLAVRGDDELAHLAERFNTMTAALKENQTKLVHSEKLAGLGRMAAGVAHEINNPIGVIIGYVKLLRRKSGAPVDAELAIIEEEADRCRQVVEDLLDLTRTPPLDADEVDLAALVDDVVKRLKDSSARATPHVRIDGRAVVVGSARKLRQVLHNLLKNALEATAEEGQVSVTIAPTPDGNVALTVVDTGPGIKPEDRRLVFEPFFTTKATGTGLGLAVSRAIARAHGGDLEVDDSKRAGAAFRLTLPAS